LCWAACGWVTACGLFASTAPAPGWRLTRSEHFEVYAQSSDQRARAILMWFEQLRVFFQQQIGGPAAGPPVRVIVFSSEAEYTPYRLRSLADAYYVGYGNQNYIVLGSDSPAKFGLASHEYAHLALRGRGLQLPPWLKEGLAEFFATLRIGPGSTWIGGELAGRMSTLRRGNWLPIPDLLSLSAEAQQREERDRADLFYGESWALTEMLVLSPHYAPGFQRLLANIATGSPGLAALNTTYGKPAEAVLRDLHAWVDHLPPPLELAAVVAGAAPVAVSEVRPLAARVLLAQLLLAAGEYTRAEARLSALAVDAPDSPDVSAALGMIALHKGDSAGARRAWKKAIDQGIADPRLCYNDATLADQAGLPPEAIRPALERAIALDPDFDDARFQLALIDKNAGRYDAAIAGLQAMRTVPETRAFAYWLALADTFNELGRRPEAQSAAKHAAEHATSGAEHAHAAQQLYIAETDPGVQFARDADGRVQLVTTRIPHQTADWNPFIEPGDDLRRVQGQLRAIDCGDVTTIHVEAGGSMLALTIPDLHHVQMRNAPAEFTCGPQNPAASVVVDYAAAGSIVRGMDFR
jgi:Tfp pilus assembly protein PilF